LQLDDVPAAEWGPGIVQDRVESAYKGGRETAILMRNAHVRIDRQVLEIPIGGKEETVVWIDCTVPAAEWGPGIVQDRVESAYKGGRERGRRADGRDESRSRATLELAASLAYRAGNVESHSRLSEQADEMAPRLC
jgi:hypothetical protein